MIRKYGKTNLFIIDSELWNWAKYQSSNLKLKSVSEYVFQNIWMDKQALIPRHYQDMSQGKAEKFVAQSTTPQTHKLEYFIGPSMGDDKQLVGVYSRLKKEFILNP